MIKNRKELKAIKKDILEQLKSGISTSDLYIKDFCNYGDDFYSPIDENNTCYFDGRLTKEEIDDENYPKVDKKEGITIQVYQDEDTNEFYIDFSIKVLLMDEDGYNSDWEYKSLNI